MTAATAAPCRPVAWDAEFWGFPIAAVEGHRLTEPRLGAIETWVQANRPRCLYFLADIDDPITPRLAERAGFHLMDVRLTFAWRCSAATAPPESVEAATTRLANADDVDALARIARASYHDTRYYYDPNFPNADCDRFYETWIRNSCAGWADAVIVWSTDGPPRGYITCHVDAATGVGKIGLVGVDAEARGQGVGRDLVEAAQRWFVAQGAGEATVVTQGRNLGAQRLYQRAGFVSADAKLWYHRWFEDTP